MKILVTGGAGFIGSQIVDRLLKEGHEAVVVDNLSSGFRRQVPEEVAFYHMDIRDPEVESVFKQEKPDLLCHHAAQLDVRVSMDDPMFDAEVNILGSLRLMELCVRYDVGKILFASTGGAVYGDQYIPASEKDLPHPISGYGVAKFSIENYLYCFHVNHGLDYVALRYANVYGPRQNAHGEAGVVAIFTRKMLSGDQVTIHGDGEQTRDYVFVDDVVEANMKALQLDEIGAFNIGTGVETSVNTMYSRLAEIMAIETPAAHGPAKLGEQQRSVLDCTKSRDILGWVPAVALGHGLKQTVDFFRTASDR